MMSSSSRHYESPSPKVSNVEESSILEVLELKSEVDSLNGLLSESASALYELSTKFHVERELNRNLAEELELSRSEVESLSSENQKLRAEIQRLRDERVHKLYNADEEESDSDLEECREPPEDFLALKLTAVQAEIASLLKSHTDVLCDSMVEAETDIVQLLARFPGVDFDKKEPEPDPYSSTKGWVNRSSRLRQQAADSTDPDSPSSICSAHSTPDPAAIGYMYGSPSERFPLSVRSTLSELDEDGSDSDGEGDGASVTSTQSTGSGGSVDQEEGKLDFKTDLDYEHEWTRAGNESLDENE